MYVESCMEITLLSKCQNRHFQEDWRPLFLEICGRKGIHVYDTKTSSPQTCHVWVRDILPEELTAISLPVRDTEPRGMGFVMLSTNICVDTKVVKSLSNFQANLLNSRKVRHCLMCSEKETNFLAVKCDRKLVTNTICVLRHKIRQDKFKHVEHRLRGAG
jgi:hypothetical protein